MGGRYHDVRWHWRAHDQGTHGPGTVHDEDQGRRPAGAQVFRVDRWLHSFLAQHLPADVDLQGRVRRVRPHDCAQEVLLRCIIAPLLAVLFSRPMSYGCWPWPLSEVHGESRTHSPQGSASSHEEK